MKKKPISLRSGLLTTIVVCWLLPIVILIALGAMLLGNSYRRAIQQEIDSGAERALEQVQMYLSSAITDSKAVSYDGVVRGAYRTYLDNGDVAALYRPVNEYLSQSFSRTERYEGVFISFWEEDIALTPYIIPKGTGGHSVLMDYHRVSGPLMEEMAAKDTGIFFLVLEDQLYVARNLLDSSFVPYASVMLRLDVAATFLPLTALSRASDLQITLDDSRFRITGEGGLEALDPQSPEGDLYYETAVDGHTLAFAATAGQFNIWENSPWFRWTILLVVLLVLPLLAVVVGLFYRNVTRPMETLAEANRQVQEGRRGYVIDSPAPNAEFDRLYAHFNAMSTELQNQFERSYLEQQATQQAKIKALQSQINPHFLNNTLEIINWEARLADDQRVSAMIEALSTMLDAALDRDGRSQIPLGEELGYVDAYLYIIRQRLGQGLRIEKTIDGAILGQLIPRLILQPLVENAVEHDLTRHHGGDLFIRAFREGQTMILEVEHDGVMTEADRENIQALLSAQPAAAQGCQVGLRNVDMRLKLLYGGRGSLSLTETGRGTILARITFPV